MLQVSDKSRVIIIIITEHTSLNSCELKVNF